MKRILLAALAFLASTTAPASACGPYGGWEHERPLTVEIAICLDTSSSMNGLIDSTRQALWAVVNDLAMAEPTPRLRVALLTYGSPHFPVEDGWVTIDSPFTEDLDSISERLFALRTNGGEELVGRVLGRAGADLDWSGSTNSMRMVVVAGNESADQDQKHRYQDVCRELIANGILVNSIYCGSPSDSIAEGWRNVATIAEGKFASIDQDNGTVTIASPFDDRLIELGTKLNETYCAFGVNGHQSWVNQSDQDLNAGGISSAVAAQRTVTKATPLYSCSSWDLVDASKAEDFDIDAIENEHLPESMRDMTREEKLAHIDKLQSKRTRIQKKIAELNTKRNAFVAMERKKLDAEDKSLDGALIKAIRSQAAARGLSFPNFSS